MEIKDFLAAPVASLIFLATIATSLLAMNNARLMEDLILVPYRAVRDKKYKTLITSGLIHADFFHLGFNMLAFYSFAFFLEKYLLGHWQFAVVYIGSLLLSGMMTLQRYKDIPSYRCLGASGAVSGIILSLILFKPTVSLLFFGIIPMPGWFFALAYLGYSYWAAKNSQDNIAHDAHLYGALSGIGLTLIVRPEVATSLRGWLELLF